MEYKDRITPIKKRIEEEVDIRYQDAKGTTEKYHGLKIIAPDATTQLKGILEVHELYTELLAAIYSLPNFSDAINRHLKAREERITEEEISGKEIAEFEAEVEPDV